MISLIAAISENRVIGNENKLLWRIPADMRRFKEKTLGHPVIMGRKTYESIGRLLPRRTNIIVTRDKNLHIEGAVMAHSIGEAIKAAYSVDPGEIFVIGGGQLYASALERADKLYLTVVKKTAKGDTYFPDYSDFANVLFEETHREGDLEYTFFELTRSGSNA